MVSNNNGRGDILQPFAEVKTIRKCKMIKTLRLTTVIAAVLAITFFIFPAFFGFGRDEQIEEFLASAGAIETFSEAQAGKPRSTDNQVSPLVKQAQAFALYLNPPPELKKPTQTARPINMPRPKSVSVKFTLIGTSYYPSHPQRSLALIDEPGKGFRWVRQASKVGHLVIEKIKDGLVIVREGEKTSELAPERQPRRSLLKGTSPGESSSAATSSILSTPTPVSSVPSPEFDITQVLSAEEIALVEEHMKQMQALTSDFESGRIDSEEMKEKSEELMEQFTSDLRALQSGSPGAKETVQAGRVSAEESDRLDDLGKQLKNIGADSNQAVDRRAKIVQQHRTMVNQDRRGTGRRYRRPATKSRGQEPNSTSPEK